MPAKLAFAVLIALAGSTLAAESYPDRPITLVVPYAAGGSSDVLARLLGERLSKSLGQQIVIDNRAGAGSRLGTEIAAKSAPDGYTLLLADMPHTIVPAIQKGVHYDPVGDFTPSGISCLARAVPSPNRERHGALGRYCQVGRDQRPVTHAASPGHLLSPLASPSDPLMWADFQSLCDLGGRLAGSSSEAAALTFARQRLTAVPGAKVCEHPVQYPGWRCRTAQLTSAMTGASLQCTPLLGTASAAGVVGEVLDLGLGRREDFERHANRIRGRIVMVRHEYPFAT